MEATPTPTPTPTTTVVSVDGVVSISPITIDPNILYPFLFLATLYVGIAIVRLIRTLSSPIGLRD